MSLLLCSEESMSIFLSLVGLLIEFLVVSIKGYNVGSKAGSFEREVVELLAGLIVGSLVGSIVGSVVGSLVKILQIKLFWAIHLW
ncbi:MAG: hypothetical protein GY830_03260 [Bacteroidetes bacterium]|nr:hypothetical protein [Bacteroidota bacterium]